MKRNIVLTADGSTTIQIPEWAEQYHSMHGAVHEARHVFLQMGIDYWLAKNTGSQTLSILEIGFGTGLNALLSLIHLQDRDIQAIYEGVEKFPVSLVEVNQLNYIDQLDATNLTAIFDEMHSSSWEQTIPLSRNFTLKKRRQDFYDIGDKSQHDVIFFDAFGARVQPELWEEPIFQKMFDALEPGGILVTYAAKGSVRRAMQAVGFIVERLPGPPGKREMLRGSKICVYI